MGLAIYPANQGKKVSSQGGANEGQVNAFSRSFVRRFEMSRKKVERSLEDLGGPLILAIEDVMKLTGYGQGKIERAIKNEELVSFKDGGSRRFHSRDVQQWTWDLRNKGLESGFADDVEI